MAEAKLYGQNKGGMSINGIIQDYYAYAGENISAGDLVEYVNGIARETNYGESVDTQLSSETKTGEVISAVTLDENRVFISHSYGSDYYLYGLVVTVNGNTITCGTDTQLSSTTHTGYRISSKLLPTGNVFIAHCYNKSRHQLKGMIVSVNETTITVETNITLSSEDYTASYIETAVLPNGNVIVTFDSGGTMARLNGIVCSIEGNTITKGTALQLSSTKNTARNVSIIPFDDKVFIAHSYGDNYYLYGMICTIADTTITVESDTQLSTSANTGKSISALPLPSGNIFIAHSYTSSLHLYGIVCALNGTTVTKGDDTAIVSLNGASASMSTSLMPNGNIFIAHSSDNTSYYLNGIIVSVDGTTVTAGTDTVLDSDAKYTGFKISSLVLDNGTIFIAHSTDGNYGLNAQIWGVDEENNIPTNNIIAAEYETQVRQATIGQFDGIAKTNGTGGDDTGHKDIVSIWTKEPIVTQEFTTADGNTLYDANGDIFLVVA